MMIGLMSVLFAIVYKITNPESQPVNFSEPIDIDVGIARGARVKSSVYSGENLLIRTELPTGEGELIVVNGKTGRIVARFNLK